MKMIAQPEEIRTAGKKLVGNADSYLDSVKGIYDTVEALKQAWQGADNQQFASTVNGYRENIDALGKVIGNYGVFEQETANSLQKLQEDIANQASAL